MVATLQVPLLLRASAARRKVWHSSGSGWRSNGAQMRGVCRGMSWRATAAQAAARRLEGPLACPCCGSGAPLSWHCAMPVCMTLA